MEKHGAGTSDGIAPSILFVEDDPPTGARLLLLAESQGWQAELACTYEQAREAGLQGRFDLLVLDRMLEDEKRDALDLVAELRHAEVALPVIVLSSLGGSLERTSGFVTGADLYLEKPFDNGELVAAAEAIFRRHGIGNFSGSLFHHGALELQLNSRTARWHGESLKLAPQSYDILEILARSRGSCVPRRSLWSAVWPNWKGEPQNEIIDQAIFRLRQELAKAEDPPSVVTVRSRGFSLDIPV
ncbi:MAG: response regulator transcription factor [Sphingomonadaceae bacterium]|nr:response regulator transcription factor [Sphingomonadaceae bacterium]